MELGQARETGRSEAVRVGLLMGWGKEDSRTQRGWGKPIKDPRAKTGSPCNHGGCGGGGARRLCVCVCVGKG